MDDVQREDAKAANQAWRRKPRKFAPKSRLGCKTCKIRRVKCDLSRPSCLKCHSTGRTCDGYSGTPLASKPEIEFRHNHNEKASRAEGIESHRPCNMISAYQPEQWHATYHRVIPQNLGPFMILPMTGSAQREVMRFFEFISIKHLNEYHPCESWRRTLMFFSQTVPSVRCAATALALIHRNYLDRDTTDRGYQPQFLENRLSDSAPLLHYNRAIQLLLNQQSGDKDETTAVTLLVCYLLTCFDHLAGNYVQAMKHLRGGVELSRNIDRAMLSNNKNNTYDNYDTSGIRTLIYQVTRQIRRLDMQAVTFLVDWTPADIQDTLASQHPPSDSPFRSLDQAADHMTSIVARVLMLRNTEQQIPPIGKMRPSPSVAKNILRGQLETWSIFFEYMQQQGNSNEMDSETYPLISLLRLQHTIAWTLLQVSGTGREMDYDNFLPQFQQCVTLAGEVAAAHVRYSGSLKPTFTPEVGIIPVLYMIGVKCRHPVVRRKVLNILRQQPMREAVWDSISAAKVVERVIEIEEGGFGEESMTQNMEQIPVWQRIETMSWIQASGQSVARIDISYTFCEQNGAHIESLVK
ncbi:sugar transporter [Colletotrichum navitas]|uniref:Sugar transporter n=1 Tax=Colletotrichum navitas TaxID=681940 RepID=A0AAD8PM31_9PEZI|nr:sugar transporter [Colletotrichum navitas]KAK1569917.1 sugar transporter [Colletotrichum navitas]